MVDSKENYKFDVEVKGLMLRMIDLIFKFDDHWCGKRFWMSDNPLTPKNDLHLISPYNITIESHIDVMRIKEMILR